MRNVRLQNVRIRPLNTGCDMNLQQRHRKQINMKVLTGHCKGFGYRDGESHLKEDLKHVWFWKHYRMT